jgi:hypothetical protein
LISGLDMAPSRALSRVREEEEHKSSLDRTPTSKTKSVAFVAARPLSPPPPVNTAATTITQALHAKTEGSNSQGPKKTAPSRQVWHPGPQETQRPSRQAATQ